MMAKSQSQKMRKCLKWSEKQLKTQRKKKTLFCFYCCKIHFFSKSIQGEFFISILFNILPNYFKYYYFVQPKDSPASFDPICLCNGCWICPSPILHLTRTN